jgi:hypothetical protein
VNPTKWSDLFEAYLIRDSKPGVSHPEPGNGFYFANGSHTTNDQGGQVWRAVYVKPRQRVLDLEILPNMCDGRVGAVKVFWARYSGKLRVIANDKLLIGSKVLADELTDVPADVAAVLGPGPNLSGQFGDF